MGKVKQFVKEHKGVVIGTIVGGVGGAAACAIAYKFGLYHGRLQGINVLMAMINADRDGTSMIVDSCLSDFNEEQMRMYVDWGNELVRHAEKELA